MMPFDVEIAMNGCDGDCEDLPDHDSHSTHCGLRLSTIARTEAKFYSIVSTLFSDALTVECELPEPPHVYTILESDLDYIRKFYESFRSTFCLRAPPCSVITTSLIA